MQQWKSGQRPFFGTHGAPPCGCPCKIVRFAHIPTRRWKKLKSCVNMPGISTTYISYIKNMWTHQHVYPSFPALLPDGTRLDRSAGWSLWNFFYCGIQDHSIGKVMLQQPFGIIILLCYTDCEVHKPRHCLFRCTDENRKHMETHTWRSEGDTTFWRCRFDPTHFRLVSICPRPWEPQWSSMKVNRDLKFFFWTSRLKGQDDSTADRSSFSSAEIRGKTESMPVSVEMQFSFWNPHIKTQTAASSKYSHSNLENSRHLKHISLSYPAHNPSQSSLV